jgi:hypothetical protein
MVHKGVGASKAGEEPSGRVRRPGGGRKKTAWSRHIDRWATESLGAGRDTTAAAGRLAPNSMSLFQPQVEAL